MTVRDITREELEAERQRLAPAAAKGDKDALSAWRKVETRIRELNESETLAALATTEEARQEQERQEEALLADTLAARDRYTKGVGDCLALAESIDKTRALLSEQVAEFRVKLRDLRPLATRAGVNLNYDRHLKEITDAVNASLSAALPGMLRGITRRTSTYLASIWKAKQGSIADRGFPERPSRGSAPVEPPQEPSRILVFIPPSRPAERSPDGFWYGPPVGVAVLKHHDGTLSESTAPTTSMMDQAAKCYLGGHIHPVTEQEARDLVNAGYEVKVQIREGGSKRYEKWEPTKEDSDAVRQ